MVKSQAFLINRATKEERRKFLFDKLVKSAIAATPTMVLVTTQGMSCNLTRFYAGLDEINEIKDMCDSYTDATTMIALMIGILMFFSGGRIFERYNGDW